MCGIAVKKPWEEAQSKFNLAPTEAREWGEITNKLAEEWRGKLEEDSDITYPVSGSGFTKKERRTPLSW
jgi:hypothetical protein